MGSEGSQVSAVLMQRNLVVSKSEVDGGENGTAMSSEKSSSICGIG